MEIDAIFFDANGTLIDILTDEGKIEIYQEIRGYLNYIGISLHKEELRDLYFQILKAQMAGLPKHSEHDVVDVWRKIIELKKTPFLKNFSDEFIDNLPHFLAGLYRSLSLCRKLQLYPGVMETINELHKDYRLGIITNAQVAYANPELRTVGLLHFFNPVVISGEHGFRKPDGRLFQIGLDALNVNPKRAVFVGNDMRDDIPGAKALGMKAVFFHSNQGHTNSYGVEPDYIINSFPEVLNAIRFFKDH